MPLALVALTMAFAGCGGGKNGKDNDKVKVVNDVRLPGDSTFYGLACDGCTDSVLVVLPTDDSDPVSFNIIGAMRDRKVFGRPKIGDMMAVVVNKSDRRKADMVIDVEELKGTWVYLSMPKMRKHAPMGGKPVAMPKPDPERDSMMKAMMVPIEQGFKIKKNYLMDPVQADGPQRRQSAGIPTGEILQGMEHPQRQARIHRGHHRDWQPQAQEGTPRKGHRGDCDDDERQSAAEIQGWDKGLLQEMILMKSARCSEHRADFILSGRMDWNPIVRPVPQPYPQQQKVRPRSFHRQWRSVADRHRHPESVWQPRGLPFRH